MTSLHPQCRALLDGLNAAFPPVDWNTVVVAHVRALLGGPSYFAPGDEVASITDLSFAGPGGPLRLRVYRPKDAGAAPAPITLFFHGGGFATGSPEGHDNVCRCLAQRAGSLVVSVDYRLAPEARFPAATADGIAALRWVQANADSLGGDPARIAVAGDSAGATLATVTATQARDLGIAIRHQLLFYPVTDMRCDFPSYSRLAEGYLLSAGMMRWFWRQYLAAPVDGQNPLASPLRQSRLDGLAPATFIIPGFDPTCDEARAYAGALREAGVQVTTHEWPDQIHGFVSMLGVLDGANGALNQGADALRRALA